MSNHNRNLLITLILVCIFSGCSSTGQTPLTQPDIKSQSQDADTHCIWGLWQFTADPSTGTLDPVQLRVGDIHLNAMKFLEPPVNVYLTVENVHFNGSVVTADIGLRHPFIGMTVYTGFDVCGVMISNGSVSGFADPDIIMPGASDTRLLNPDGFTRWWDPSEFPVNNGSMFTYQDGILGSPDSQSDFNSTLNGYKYFADGLAIDGDYLDVPAAQRGLFSAGTKNVRRYEISLQSGLVFNYAVDANWKMPVGDPPFTAPDDFLPGVNRVEAWGAGVVESGNSLYNDGQGQLGGTLELSIDIYDHFNADLNTVLVESPGNFTQVTSSTPIGGGEGYST